MGKNRWYSDVNVQFGEWVFKFPQKAENRIEIFTTFVRELDRISRKYHILEIASLYGVPYDFSGTGYTVADYKMEQAIETDILPLNIYTNLEFDNIRKPTTTRVCYFNLEGQVIEEDVSELGTILSNNSHEKVIWRYRQNTPPIAILAYNLSMTEENLENLIDGLSLTVSFYLNSNIWFPILPTGYDITTGRITTSENRKLARCHTPRLNLFLKDMKQLAEEVGAEWSLELAGVLKFYHDMLSETGIKLDI